MGKRKESGRVPGGYLDEMHHGRQGLAGVWLIWYLGPGEGVKLVREEPHPLAWPLEGSQCQPHLGLVPGFKFCSYQQTTVPGLGPVLAHAATCPA